MRCERVVVLVSISALLDESECKTRNTEKFEFFQFFGPRVSIVWGVMEKQEETSDNIRRK